jgi:hypothetical protein
MGDEVCTPFKSHPLAIRCWFSEGLDKKLRALDASTTKRKSVSSPKQTYKCPFIVSYSYIGYPRVDQLKKPNIFYRVKVTKVVLRHTCQLNTPCHRIAVQKSGKLQPNLEVLNHVIDNMRDRPNQPTAILKDTLKRYLPATFANVDAQYCANFRARVKIFFLKNCNRPCGMKEAQDLLVGLSRPDTASHETLDTYDPFVKMNLKSMLENILATDHGTWHALHFMEECNKVAVGFDYRVWYSENGEPRGICWMSPEMRTDLIRFGTHMFLDSKKTQYNGIGWPYIGPTVKNDEMKVRVLGESIVMGEALDAYEWVLRSIV